MSNDLLLAEVGWDAGFALPVANAENKALQEEVSNKCMLNNVSEKTILRGVCT